MPDTRDLSFAFACGYDNSYLDAEPQLLLGSAFVTAINHCPYSHSQFRIAFAKGWLCRNSLGLVLSEFRKHHTPGYGLLEDAKRWFDGGLASEVIAKNEKWERLFGRLSVPVPE
jgi:hypothetical protein